MKHVDGVFCMDSIGVVSLLHTSQSQLVTADLAVAFGPLPTAGIWLVCEGIKVENICSSYCTTVWITQYTEEPFSSAL